jgi:peptidoglycan/LPS O-acetylase OafA/YrhL
MRFVKSYWVIPIFTVQLVLLWSRIPLYLKIVEILMAFLPLTTISDPSGKISQILEIPFLRWIGRLSYSLYLWQQLFLPHRFEGTPLGMVQTFPWNWLCIVAAACISYYLVERPFIQLGKRFSRRSAGLQVRGFPESNGLRTLSGSGDSETQ